MKTCTPAAVKLLLDGTLAFAQMEAAGVRVDKGYVEAKHAELTGQVNDLYRQLKADKEMYKPWVKRFGERTNLLSRDQLRDVLFTDLGLQPTGLTAKGKLSTDKTVLDKIDLPGVRLFRQMEQLQDIQSTYLDGIRREMVEHPGTGCWFVHPNYALNKAATYRPNCTDPNWTNIPKRDQELAQLVRRAYIPRKGRHLCEIDFSQVEVRVAACYTRDPALMKYVTSGADMHADVGRQVFFLDADQISKMKKTARHSAKNQIVFPWFYGSAWFKCAPLIWDEMTRPRKGAPHGWELPDGTPLVKHLRHNGIKALGDCEPKGEPAAGTFAHHLKKIERHFWDRRFPVYRDWKRSFFDQYQREGGFSTLTGFRVNTQLMRNDVVNYPIQGSAFHCELWTIIEALKKLRKYKMKSLIVGQIYDCDVGDVPKAEVNAYLDLIYNLKTRDLPKAWRWVCVPMGAECEVAPAGESWAAVKEWKRGRDGWALPA